jgi:coiled-coil and C2 domain-containing protein 2A
VRRILKSILQRLEADARDALTSKPEELRAELAETLQSYSVIGFPLNLTWTDIRQVIDALDATDIHNSGGKELKFALAVHVVAYPNSVYSIWVYAAALTSLR